MQSRNWVLVVVLMTAACGSSSEQAYPNDSSAESTPEVVYRVLDTGDLESADKIVAGVWPVPRYDDVALPGPLTWAEDPYNAKYWRFIFYGLRPVAHVLWAYRTTGEAVYRDTLIGIVTSFLERDRQAATEQSFVWDKHTAAYRTMMLVNIRAKLDRGGDLTPALRDALDNEIAIHGAFLADSRHYEPGYNHGVAEAAALLLVAQSFPSLPHSTAWRATALDRIRALLDDVVDPDGVEVEQSPYYHFYFLTGFWDLYRWARSLDIELAPGIDERITAMLHYAAHIVLPDGTLPLMGASLARNVRKTHDAYYDEMATLSPEFDYVLSAGARGSVPAQSIVLFPSSGQAILHSGFQPAPANTKDTHVILDVGPYRTSHSHLDALAVHVYAGGRPLLIDSGLYSYDAGDNFTYFHGTGAHNTIVVDDKDQHQGTAIAGLTASGPSWRYQSGRHELYDGVVHRRAVVLLRADLVLVLDDLVSAASHTYDQAWHLPPAADVTIAGLTAIATFNGTARLAIRQIDPAGITLTEHIGSTSPIDGWYSSAYGVKVAAPALRYHQTGTNARFATLLAAGSFATKTFTNSVSIDATGTWTVTICGPSGAQFQVGVTSLAASGESATVSAASCSAAAAAR